MNYSRSWSPLKERELYEYRKEHPEHAHLSTDYLQQLIDFKLRLKEIYKTFCKFNPEPMSIMRHNVIYYHQNWTDIAFESRKKVDEVFQENLDRFLKVFPKDVVLETYEMLRQGFLQPLDTIYYMMFLSGFCDYYRDAFLIEDAANPPKVNRK